ncbi:hypothetical protein ACVIJW_002613 [Bradyrhizobium barranii subsp. barranii]
MEGSCCRVVRKHRAFPADGFQILGWTASVIPALRKSPGDAEPCNRHCNPSGSALVTFIPEWLNLSQFHLWTSLSMAARQRRCYQRNNIRCARMGDYGTGVLSYDRPWVIRTPGWAWHFTRTVLAGNAPNLQCNTRHGLQRTQFLTCLNVISACPFGVSVRPGVKGSSWRRAAIRPKQHVSDRV